MPEDAHPVGPIKVLIALPLTLDSEAYAARINREPGWRAQFPAESQAWDVRLSDRCRLSVSPIEGPTDQGPTVLVANPNPMPNESPNCSCCWAVPRGAAWPSLFRALSEAAGRLPDGSGNDTLAKLTRRETEVLKLVGLGKSVSECAHVLGVTPSTVGNHKYRLMRKLKVTTSLQLLRIAVSNGLADLE